MAVPGRALLSPFTVTVSATQLSKTKSIPVVAAPGATIAGAPPLLWIPTSPAWPMPLKTVVV